MPLRKILVLNGHPAQASLTGHLAHTYADAASAAGHTVRSMDLHGMQFDPDYEFGGYSARKPLEPVLETFLESLEWCDHFVVATPLWWGSLPAKLKGLFDRSLLPGRAFDTRNTTRLGLPKPLLTGRTAQVIMTADTPMLFFRLMYHRSALRTLQSQVLGFVGMKVAKPLYFSGTSHPKNGAVERWVTATKQRAQAVG